MTKKKIIMFITSFVLLVSLFSFVVYAAFTYVNKFNITLDTHQIQNATLTEPTEELNFTFETPGQRTNNYDYTLTNGDEKNYSYSFSLNLTSTVEIAENRIELYDMIYVYQNNEYVGLLSDFVISDITRAPKDLPIVDFIFPEESRTTSLSFELHNGADSLYTGGTISLQLKCKVQTPNVQEYIFVNDMTSLKKAIDDINRSTSKKTIVLTSDITVTEELTIEKVCAIDVCGHTFTLNQNMNINSNVELFDSRNITSTVSGEAFFVLATEQSFIIPDFDIKTRCSISNFSEEAFIQASKEWLENHKIVSDATFRAINYLDMYLSDSLQLRVNQVLSTDGIISRSDYSINTSILISIRSTTTNLEVSIKVIGNDDLYNQILTSSLAHLTQFESEDNDIQLGYNIFLPTSVKEYNATISWFSNRADIMSNDGKLLTEQGFVTLTATIKINDKVYAKNYYIHVVQQDSLSKLQYLALRIEQTALLNTVGTAGTIVLPTVYNEAIETYYLNWTDNKNLGITELTYEVESSYYYITLDRTFGSTTTETQLLDYQQLEAASIYLNQITYQTSARIIIRGAFDNGDVEETYINISIELSQSQIANQIFDDIQLELNNVNVLQNMLDTRESSGINFESGDFNVPKVVATANIAYSPVTSTVDYSNFYEIIENDEYYTIHFKDYSYFNIADSSIEILVSIETEEVGTVVSRTLYFRVPGAITTRNFTAFSDVGLSSASNLTNVFYTIKYQVLQQSSSSMPFYRDSVNNRDYLLTEITDKTWITGLQGYILIYDIERTEELIFEYGADTIIVNYYDLELLRVLLDWATSTTKYDLADEYKVYLDSDLLWLTGKSDGLATLCDEEIALIVNYCQKYPAFSSIWNNAIDVLDNTLSEADVAALLGTLSSDQLFVSILNWILDSNNTQTLYEYLAFGTEGSTIIIQDYLRTYYTQVYDAVDASTIRSEIAAIIKDELSSTHLEADKIALAAAYAVLRDNPDVTDDIYPDLYASKVAEYEANPELLETDYNQALDAEVEEEIIAIGNTDRQKVWMINYRMNSLTDAEKSTMFKTYFIQKLKDDYRGENEIDLNIPSEFFDIQNNGLASVSNDEERVITYYISANKDITTYKSFYEAWNAALARSDNENKVENNIYEIKEIAIQTSSLGLNSCYDPIFLSILEWARYNIESEPTDSTTQTLSTYVGQYEGIENIFEPTELATKNDWLFASVSGWLGSDTGCNDFTSSAEWNIISKYGKLYGLDSTDYFGYSYTVVGKTTSSSEPTIDSTGTIVQTHYAHASFLLAGNQYQLGSFLTNVFLNTLITAINEKYTLSADSSTASIISDYKTVLESVMKVSSADATTFNIQTIQSLGLTTALGSVTINDIEYDITNYIVNDGYSTISWSEYIVLLAYFNHAFDLICSDWLVNGSVSANLKTVITRFYWSNSALNMDVNDTVYNSQIELLGMISELGSFNMIIDLITNFGDGVIESYEDDLTTISLSEFRTLAETYQDNTAFLSALDSAISAYRILYDSNGLYLGVEEVTEGVDRTLSDQDKSSIIDYVNSTLNPTNATIDYVYFPIDVIDDEIEAFDVLRYFDNLKSLSFLGNQFHTLFSSSTDSNRLFDIVCNAVGGLEELTMNYCLLSDITSISNLLELRSLDLKGNNQTASTVNSETNKYNYPFDDISPLITLMYNKKEAGTSGIDYLNIHDTRVNFARAQLYFIKLYEFSSDVESNPRYYYTADGVETLFIISEGNEVAMELATLLKEIEVIRNNQVTLTNAVTTNIYNDDNTSTKYIGSVTWAIFSGSSVLGINGAGNKLTAYRDGTAIVSATVSVMVNGVEQRYVRYFIVEVIYRN